jgi:hypothetical protein
MGETEQSQATKQCPLCGEQILAVAVRCKHCSGDLSAKAKANKGGKGPFVLALIASFLLLYVSSDNAWLGLLLNIAALGLAVVLLVPSLRRKFYAASPIKFDATRAPILAAVVLGTIGGVWGGSLAIDHLAQGYRAKLLLKDQLQAVKPASGTTQLTQAQFDEARKKQKKEAAAAKQRQQQDLMNRLTSLSKEHKDSDAMNAYVALVDAGVDDQIIRTMLVETGMGWIADINKKARLKGDANEVIQLNRLTAAVASMVTKDEDKKAIQEVRAKIGVRQQEIGEADAKEQARTEKEAKKRVADDAKQSKASAEPQASSTKSNTDGATVRSAIPYFWEKRFAENGLDATVKVGGSANTTITIYMPAATKATIYQLFESGELLTTFRDAGFRRVLVRPWEYGEPAPPGKWHWDKTL